MQNHHDMSHDQTTALVDLFKQPSISKEPKCNLCGKPSLGLKAHVSRHLQDLALFAIPRSDYITDDGDERIENETNRAERIESNTIKSEVLAISSLDNVPYYESHLVKFTNTNGCSREHLHLRIEVKVTPRDWNLLCGRSNTLSQSVRSPTKMR